MDTTAGLRSRAQRVTEPPGVLLAKLEPKSVSPAQLLYAKKIALGKGVVIPDEAKANSAAMAAWIDSNKGTKRRKSARKTAFRPVEQLRLNRRHRGR